ncbi:MAG: PKD domain-containing protein [Actinomycetales bacterium]|nr:PKD domain-containing protein [Actinomycetales bacterium]
MPLADVKCAVHEAISKRIPTPTVTSAPPGKSLVNLFTIYSTAPAPEQAITFTTPVPGEVRAIPEYTWNFDDGRTGIGPGTPFTETHLPSRSPGYYLGATYTTPGTKHVTLTVTWRVTFRLEGVTDIPLTPIIMTATEDKQVATARAVLVN